MGIVGVDLPTAALAALLQNTAIASWGKQKAAGRAAPLTIFAASRAAQSRRDVSCWLRGCYLQTVGCLAGRLLPKLLLGVGKKRTLKLRCQSLGRHRRHQSGGRQRPHADWLTTMQSLIGGQAPNAAVCFRLVPLSGGRQQ